MKAVISFLLLSFLITRSLSQEPKKEQSEPRSLTDPEAVQAYEDTILKYLEDGQYDALEDQFAEVQDRSVQTQDGTPKIWAYFRAFDLPDKPLDEIKALVPKIRTWRDNRPNSVAALLALANVLIRQAGKVRQLSSEEHLDLSDPKIKQTLQEPLVEAAKIILSPNKPVPAIQLQPEFFTIAINLFGNLDDIPWSQVEDTVNRGVLLDPTYVPLYHAAFGWLATRPPEISSTLPKPVDWITEILKVEPDDQKDTADQKAKTYTQALAFRNQRVIPLKVQQADWTTLKRGLALLVHSYPKSTEWATRYLALAYTMRDLPATKDALDVLQGNYSPRVIGDPTFFQEASIWAQNPNHD